MTAGQPAMTQARHDSVAEINQALQILRAHKAYPLPPPLIIVEPKPTRTRKRRPTLEARATLPPTLPPRLINRDAAAAYVGVSPNTFDKMIADRLMPNPRQLTERRLAWDVRQLDAAIDRLPVDGEATTDTDTATDHSWDDIDAQTKTKSPVH